jgi:hypothetical protein
LHGLPISLKVSSLISIRVEGRMVDVLSLFLPLLRFILSLSYFYLSIISTGSENSPPSILTPT